MNFLKPFAAWVIALRANLFGWARFKLTLLYLIIITVIVLIFSILFYYTILDAVQVNLATTVTDALFQSVIMQDVSERSRNLIIVGDLLILLVAAILSYVLAGKTLQPIQTAMQLQRQFTADASHELRTPLTILKTNLEVALQHRTLSNHQLRNMMQSDLEEVNRLVHITEQLLTLLKQTDATTSLQLTPVMLNTTCQHVLQKLQLVAQQNHITLMLAKSDSGIILANPSAIEAILFNLLQNALDYTPADGKITVTIEQHGQSMHLQVQDTGCGIAAEHLPHLFNRFYKVDQARNYKIGGAGLGLAIVKNLVQQQSGVIQVNSIVGVGTTITVIWPLYTI